MRILVAPDKFKGTLTARQAGEAIASGLREILPDATIDVLPMAVVLVDRYGEVAFREHQPIEAQALLEMLQGIFTPPREIHPEYAGQA